MLLSYPQTHVAFTSPLHSHPFPSSLHSNRRLMTDQQCLLYPPVCMVVVGFQSSPCLDHQVTRNSSHRHMKPRHFLGSLQGQCGLILNSLTWPQRLTMNRGIKFGIAPYYYPEELNIFKDPRNQLWNPWESLLPSCKHYNFLTWFPKALEASNPDGILFQQSTMQDRLCYSPLRTNNSATRFVRMCPPTAVELKHSGD